MTDLIQPPENCSMNAEEYTAYIEALVAKAPPLSPEVRDDLYVLLAPMREAIAARVAARVRRNQKGNAA